MTPTHHKSLMWDPWWKGYSLVEFYEESISRLLYSLPMYTMDIDWQNGIHNGVAIPNILMD